MHISDVTLCVLGESGRRQRAGSERAPRAGHRPVRVRGHQGEHRQRQGVGRISRGAPERSRATQAREARD